MASSVQYYSLNDTSFDNTTPFDEIEPIYSQVCRLINSGLESCNSDNTTPPLSNATNCPTHFAQSLIYLVLPSSLREDIIDKVSVIVNNRILYKLSMDELLNHIEINELLQGEYNIDPVNLLRFNSYQQKRLYAYFYEGLYEESIDKYLSLNHQF